MIKPCWDISIWSGASIRCWFPTISKRRRAGSSERQPPSPCTFTGGRVLTSMGRKSFGSASGDRQASNVRGESRSGAGWGGPYWGEAARLAPAMNVRAGAGAAASSTINRSVLCPSAAGQAERRIKGSVLSGQNPGRVLLSWSTEGSPAFAVSIRREESKSMAATTGISTKPVLASGTTGSEPLHAGEWVNGPAGATTTGWVPVLGVDPASADKYENTAAAPPVRNARAIAAQTFEKS